MEMSNSKDTEEPLLDSKKMEETFLAKMCVGWRVTIYEPVRDRLGLRLGELLSVTIQKDEFLAKLCVGWRVTIYEPVRNRLDLKIGELVRVTIRKEQF